MHLTRYIPNKMVLRRSLIWMIVLAVVVFVLPNVLAQEGGEVLEAVEEAEAHSENAFIPLLLVLGIVILASRLGGAIARFLKQPRVLGQLIIGVILGPTLIDFLHTPILGGAELAETVNELAELGVLLLMFNIGLGVHIEELVEVGVVALLAGFLGAIVPVVLTVAVLIPAGFSWEPALFAGVVLAATSVSISAQVLLELGYLRTKEGAGLLATALVDDVLAILLVSLTVAITATGSAEALDVGELVIIVVRMVAFIGISFVIAWFGLPRLMEALAKRPYFSQPHGLPIWALIAALLFGWAAEYFGGVAAITGAFIAGVGLSRLNDQRIEAQIEEAMENIAYVFLVPIFFVNVGLQTDLSTYPVDALPLTLLLIVVAIISKVLGSGVGARVGGFNNIESLRLGVCMISRGEVGLIIASIGLSSGMFGPRFDPDGGLFASLFVVILFTTLIAPPLVRLVFQSKETEQTDQRKIASSSA